MKNKPMILCAYHSNLYMDAFIGHVKEIKEKGFTHILFCITEADLLFNLEVYQEFKDYAESQGLKTWATYWGWSAGEAVVSKKISLFEWVSEVSKLFDEIMIDEPKESIQQDCSFLKRAYPKCNFHLCLSDDTFNRMSGQEIQKLPVKSLGLSCYHLGHNDWIKVTKRTIEWCCRLKLLRPDDNFIFIQGFDIESGMEDLPMIVKDIAAAYGIENFGFWSFRSTEATGKKRPKNHQQVWSKIKF